MDEFFDSGDTHSSELFLDEGVIVKGESLSSDLSETTLVDQVTNKGTRWVSRDMVSDGTRK
jgi:hypothetical protein